MTTITPVNEKARRRAAADITPARMRCGPSTPGSTRGGTPTAPVTNASTAGSSHQWDGDRAMTAAVPWTDPDGKVHERECGSDCTRCGVVCDGDSHTGRAKVACDECIRLGIVAYALSHVCGKECRV